MVQSKKIQFLYLDNSQFNLKWINQLAKDFDWYSLAIDNDNDLDSWINELRPDFFLINEFYINSFLNLKQSTKQNVKKVFILKDNETNDVIDLSKIDYTRSEIELYGKINPVIIKEIFSNFEKVNH